MNEKIKFDFQNKTLTASTINSKILNMTGAYLVFTILLCLVVNTLLLDVFVRFKQLRTSLNKLIIVLTAFNLFGSIQFPLVIHSHFFHTYTFFIRFF